MFFIKDLDKKKAFGIQVALSNKHPIAKTAYKDFYDRLGLDTNTDEVTIYVISSRKNTEGYANAYEMDKMSFYKNYGQAGTLPKLYFARISTLTNFELELINH